jgi:hypothetical protein
VASASASEVKAMTARPNKRESASVDPVDPPFSIGGAIFPGVSIAATALEFMAKLLMGRNLPKQDGVSELNDHTLANRFQTERARTASETGSLSIRMIFSAIQRQPFSVYAAAFAANCCILAVCEAARVRSI